MADATRSERLDRLPFTPLHRRLVVIAGAGWAMDAMDVGLISFVMASLAVQWKLDAATLSWIGAVGFVGMALGASLGGSVADRVGRRFVFAATLLIYGVATGAAAFSWTVASLLFFRFLIGFGLGAELPVASTLVSEFAPARIRGRVVVMLEAFWAVGWILAALIGTYVIPRSDDGWRWAFAIGALPALYSGWCAARCRNPSAFLSAKAAWTRRRRWCGASRRPLACRVRSASRSRRPRPRRAGGAGRVVAGPLARRTLALWLVWFGINFAYYGAFIWIPTLLTGAGSAW